MSVWFNFRPEPFRLHLQSLKALFCKYRVIFVIAVLKRVVEVYTTPQKGSLPLMERNSSEIHSQTVGEMLLFQRNNNSLKNQG